MASASRQAPAPVHCRSTAPPSRGIRPPSGAYPSRHIRSRDRPSSWPGHRSCASAGSTAREAALLHPSSWRKGRVTRRQPAISYPLAQASAAPRRHAPPWLAVSRHTPARYTGTQRRDKRRVWKSSTVAATFLEGRIPIDRDAGKLLGPAARPHHLDPGRHRRATQADEDPWIVGRRVTSVRSRTAPDGRTVVPDHAGARAEHVTERRRAHEAQSDPMIATSDVVDEESDRSAVVRHDHVRVAVVVDVA